MCNESDSSSLTEAPSDDELRSPTPPLQAAAPPEAAPKVVRGRKRKTTKTAAPGNGTTVSIEESATLENGRKRKRQKKGKKKDENVEEDEKMVPSLSKALRSVVKIGAHVSMAGGVENAVRNAVSIGSVPPSSLLPVPYLCVKKVNGVEPMRLRYF